MLRLVARNPIVPRELILGPFTVADARRAGLKRWNLEGASWRRLGPGVYAWAGLAENPMLRLAAARLRIPESAAYSGKTAAWLHGLDVAPCDPIEVILDGHGEGWERGGVRLHRANLDYGDLVVLRGFRTTTLVRTLCDLSRRLSLVESVVITDMALHAGLIKPAELNRLVDGKAGQKGVGAARLMLDFAEAGAESPMETRLRMLQVLNGLPRPEVQVTIRDKTGSFVGRPDLYYRAHRLGIEYDGQTHRVSLVEDNRRQNRLLLAESAFSASQRPTCSAGRTAWWPRSEMRSLRPLPNPHSTVQCGHRVEGKPAYDSPMRVRLG